MRQADFAQAIQEEFALLRIVLFQPVIVAVVKAKGRDGRFLQWRCGTDGQEIVDFAGNFDNLGAGDDVAKTPAGDGIGLGEGTAGNRALPHVRQRGKVDILVRLVDDMLVDFIGDDPGIVFFRQVGDNL